METPPTFYFVSHAKSEADILPRRSLVALSVVIASRTARGKANRHAGNDLPLDAFGSSHERETVATNRRYCFGAHFPAFVLNLFPKIAFFRFLSFKPPTSQMESLFQQSFRSSTEACTSALQQSRLGNVPLADKDLDTANTTAPDEYALADKTYMQLMDELAARKFAGVPAGMRANLLSYYSQPGRDPLKKKERKRWEKTERELAQLRATAAVE
jgi:hypothetical protein